MILNKTLAACLLLLSLGANAQGLKNNGAQIVVKNAANLVVQGKVDNLSSGTIALNDGVVKLTGDWNNAATFTAGTGTVVFNGTTAQDITNSETFYNAIVESGASVNIDSKKGTTVTNTLTNNAGVGGIIIQADATSQGMLLLPEAHAAVDATVERYLVNDEKTILNFMVESPSTATITGYTPDGFFVSEYKENTPASGDDATNIGNYWHSVYKENLSTTKGYVVTNNNSGKTDVTLNIGGPLFSGDYSITGLSYTQIGIGVYNGWHIIPNRYPTYLLLDNTLSTANMDGSVYYYNGTGFDSYVLLTGIKSGAFNGYVPAGGAVFMIANASTGSVSIAAAKRSLTNTATKKSDLKQLNISIRGNELADNMVIYTYAGATSEFDTDLDAVKFPGLAETPQIYRVLNEQKLSIDALPEVTEGLSIPIRVFTPKASSYTISVSDMVFEGQELRVENQATGEVYTDREFTIQGEVNKTFDLSLVFGKKTLNTLPATASRHKIFTAQGNLRIELKQANAATVDVFDALGKRVKNVNMTSSTAEVVLPTGNYVVRLSGNFAQQTAHIMIVK